jgi:hypothetical protein
MQYALIKKTRLREISSFFGWGQFIGGLERYMLGQGRQPRISIKLSPRSTQALARIIGVRKVMRLF